MLRLATLALALLLPAAALAQSNGAMTKRESKFPVVETVERLAKEVEAKGLKVAARIDHAAGAKAAGLELPPTVLVLFGNPKLGTPLMQETAHMGLELPMRVLVWQDRAGKVWVGYTPPSTLQARHGIAGADNIKALQTMAGALDAFSKAAAGAN